MTRRFLVATVCLSATVAFLVGLVVAGTMTPTPAVSATPERPGPERASAPRSLPSTDISFADVAERLNPAVVSIDATSRGGTRTRRRQGLTPEVPPPDPFDPQPRERDGPRLGTGAGFIIDPSGYILTNHHVVEGAERIVVRLTDGRTLRGEAVGSDPDTDIALIRVESPRPLPFAPLGDSDELRVGEWVVAIGNPLSYEHTVTVGVVSFIGRKLFDSSLDRYIQTDAAINFGNSGGPLISARGEVIGINAAISSRASNIGFAVPINQAKAILPQLRDKGHVSRGYIGVMLRDVDQDLQRALALKSATGALVQDVTPDSPGARAGLRTYDVIVAVDGAPIDGNDALVRLIAARQPGSTATVQIVRDGRPASVTLKLAERPQRDRRTVTGSDQSPGRRGTLLGLSVREVDERTSARFGLPRGSRGVVVSGIEPMSPAFDADIERGHLLLEVNRQPVRNVEDFRRLTDPARPGDILTMYLYKPELNQRALETLKIDPPLKPRILVIDDEAAIRDSVRMILEYEHYECIGASSGPEGLTILKRDQPDMVLLDIKMPGMSGLEVLGEIRKVDEGVPVAMMSGHGTVADAMQATRLGALDFIEKPFTSERVLVTVAKGLEVRQLKRENRELKLAMEAKYEIVGDSPALRAVLDSVRKAAPTNATVLLTGESGVGKELVARTVHRNSSRAGQRFVQVNCAAIPEELIESELFGHEKGSFTGATEKQIGKFEQADRGTIFLDEVGDMSPKTQAKVLRVLQEQEVERLGSARTIKVDVRVIAATNKNLEEAIARGEFREDLYFRLNVIPIVVPPLRERRADIPQLVQHLAARTSEEHNIKPKKFDPRAMEALQRYRWRGNIRELRNTVERLMIMSAGDAVRFEDLPPEIRGAAPAGAPPLDAAQAPAAQASSPAPQAGTLREFKDAAERAFLVQKLRENGWNISKTADVIDTPRSNLYKKLEQYAIKQEVDG